MRTQTQIGETQISETQIRETQICEDDEERLSSKDDCERLLRTRKRLNDLYECFARAEINQDECDIKMHEIMNDIGMDGSKQFADNHLMIDNALQNNIFYQSRRVVRALGRTLDLTSEDFESSIDSMKAVFDQDTRRELADLGSKLFEISLKYNQILNRIF